MSVQADPLIEAESAFPEGPPDVRRRLVPSWPIHRDVELVVGFVLLGLLVGLCLLGPVFSPYESDTLAAAPLLAPSAAHPFGTDTLGRDVFVRATDGGRMDLFIAVVGVLVPLATGTVLGLVGALAKRRWIDTVIMRVTDVVLAFPFVVLVLALVVILGADKSLGPLPGGTPALLISLFLVNWTIYARLARATALSLRQRDYVLAAELLGYSRWRIVRRHLLRTVASTTATYAVSDAVLVLIVAASLPFLGAGIQPPAPEWGNIMYEGRTVLVEAWWMTLMPGLMLMTFGLAVSLIADSLISRSREATE